MIHWYDQIYELFYKNLQAKYNLLYLMNINLVLFIYSKIVSIKTKK